MSTKLDEVFEKPVGKQLVKRDPQFEKEVNDYLESIKKVVEKSETKPPRRRNNVSDEGKKIMLANLTKGREKRKENITKKNESEKKNKPAEVMPVVPEPAAKVDPPKEEPKPIAKVAPAAAPALAPVEPATIAAPKVALSKVTPPIIAKPTPVLFSMIKRPLW